MLDLTECVATARAIATQQGRESDAPYMRRLLERLAKAWPYGSVTHTKLNVGRGGLRIPGQVPGRAPPTQAQKLHPELEQSLNKKPKDWNMERYFSKPITKALDCVTGLGLPPAVEHELSTFIKSEVDVAPNAIQLKKSLFQKLIGESYPSEVRSIVTNRAVQLMRSRLAKAGQPEVLQPEDLAQLIKSEPIPECEAFYTIPLEKASPGGPSYTSRKWVGGKWVYSYPSKGKKKPPKHMREAAREALTTIAPHKQTTEEEEQQALHRLTSLDAQMRKMKKAEARGGKYYRRVSSPDGKKHRYFYNKEDYDKHSGKHLDGTEAQDAYVGKAALAMVTKAGKNGVGVKDFAKLVARHGSKCVHKACAGMVKSGKAKYKGGKFYFTGEQELQKPEPNKPGPNKTQEQSGKEQEAEAKKSFTFVIPR